MEEFSQKIFSPIGMDGAALLRAFEESHHRQQWFCFQDHGLTKRGAQTKTVPLQILKVKINFEKIALSLSTIEHRPKML